MHLDAKVDSNVHVVLNLTYVTEYSNIETELCIGNKCIPYLGVFIKDPTDINKSFIFGENAYRYYIYISGTDDEYTVGLHNIPNKNLYLRIIVDPFASPKRVHLIFPPTNETIAQCIISLSYTCSLSGQTKLSAQNIIINTIIY